MGFISVGYIYSRRADWIWFVWLPAFAILFALVCESWLTFVALASVNLWVTIPHHFATWCRTYGLREDWQRFRTRVIVGPIIIVAAILAGATWAPLTVFLLTTLWDHQHSVMQQHGLARIYDFKARSGGPTMGRLDLWLNIVLFVNMLLTVPLWTEVWVHQLYAWSLPVDASAVRFIHSLSYTSTFAYVIFYAWRVTQSVKKGTTINPMKYLFLSSSYALWYFAAWHTNSLLVYGVAHRLMHGVQYLVIVYLFLMRKNALTGEKPWVLPGMNWASFVMMGFVYTFAFQVLLVRPLGEFAFGLWNLPAIGAAHVNQWFGARAYELYASTLISSTALIHYYFDSFIWKIRDQRVQQGL